MLQLLGVEFHPLAHTQDVADGLSFMGRWQAMQA
jgi:hypothetical protein